MSVTIEIGFEGEPSESARELPIVYGGLRIEVNGRELTRYQNQKEMSEEVAQREQYEMTWYDEVGEELSVDPYHFKGEYVTVDLGRLSDAFIECVQLSPDEYREVPASLAKTASDIVFSYIDAEHLRIAFQNRKPNRDTHRPSMEVACGYSVSRAEFCDELIASNEALLSHLECIEEETDMPDSSAIKEVREGTQSAIDALKDIQTERE